jgi:hypothetical protein
LHAVGSSKPVQMLLEHDLVDELRLMIDPLLLGGGKGIFRNDGVKRPLRLVAPGDDDGRDPRDLRGHAVAASDLEHAVVGTNAKLIDDGLEALAHRRIMRRRHAAASRLSAAARRATDASRQRSCSRVRSLACSSRVAPSRRWSSWISRVRAWIRRMSRTSSRRSCARGSNGLTLRVAGIVIHP